MTKEQVLTNKVILKKQKIRKWTIWNLIFAVLATSVIINIVYLPKYFMLKNHNEQTLNINIAAYDNSNLIFLFHYQSTMATVGDLMASYSDTYNLKNIGTFGRALIGVYNDETKTWLCGEFSSNHYWSIYYNGEMAQVGIDNLYLHMNDKIELYYTTI